MKDSPQGASVVPRQAVAASTALRSSGMDGTTVPRPAADQSGPAKNTDTR